MHRTSFLDEYNTKRSCSKTILNPTRFVIVRYTVPCRSQEITVNEVNGDEVILEAGWLQNLLPGGYNVYETTAIKAGVDLGKESSDWLGTVDVSEGGIGPVQTSSLIVERNTDKDKQITVSICLQINPGLS